jgi:3-mercaptopyruvate sulfurtransferase SseA
MGLLGGIVGVLIVVGAWMLMRKPETPPPPAPVPVTETAHTEDDHDHNVGGPRISVDELKQLHQAGNVTVIDVRDANAYMGGHIPGALHIPLAFVQGEISYLPRGKKIVTYCT